MKRVLAALGAVIVLAIAGTAVGVWRLHDAQGDRLPEISAYSHGHSVRVGPFQYCEVLNLDDCKEPRDAGELRVDEDNPVQLSVPSAVSRAPWRLLRVYENPIDTTVTYYAPKTTLAVTIPTLDPNRGRLTGLAVQLLTLVQDQDGQEFALPHAEWSISTVWP
ncbi:MULTISPECIES: DUF2771 domain-containing protein [Mycolicibacterium]|uniref:DUF2771 domain-containing protein n=3 Tax=Mycolicibacterium fortuitum TaxID=1766 RepID=A0A1A3LPI0_MYCFO|nr:MULTISPECIES: DUF2771 domain-containing protein [Mycolicibacterium]AIY49228.1 putative exported protein [Mycobacterium sp. VKM Ac-1817D]MDO3239906.1 DUF2771 domain-containing protein [Mycobacteroides abscessus subsp. abscessus]CRL80377.1 hypothetical protein CPGR_03580 [Mycolicibacter nonchromogenicus]AMD56361.1 hypothetical protein ATO49_05455 [Mycolicibacterium fortuitum subsp. fortuitum DSM 46621 = ATCC 6841 = JCM 6387]EJZ13566.1 hypothetical protein MFORT_14100 [Mycolicibacterium fortui